MDVLYLGDEFCFWVQSIDQNIFFLGNCHNFSVWRQSHFWTWINHHIFHFARGHTFWWLEFRIYFENLPCLIFGYCGQVRRVATPGHMKYARSMTGAFESSHYFVKSFCCFYSPNFYIRRKATSRNVIATRRCATKILRGWKKYDVRKRDIFKKLTRRNA